MNWKSLGEATDWASVLARDLVNESKSDGMCDHTACLPEPVSLTDK